MSLLALLVLTALPQVAMDPVGPIMQPTTYVSPSGAWKLFVDPTRRTGAGPARYRMEHDGTEAWSGEKRFTLFEADVDDRGYVGGYTEPSGIGCWNCEFVLATISPAGDEWLSTDVIRVRRGGCTPSAGEYLRGTFVHGELDRFVVRLSELDLDRDPQTIERWRVYRLSTHEFVEEVTPASPIDIDPGRVSYSAHAVRGTPLTLVHWLTLSTEPQTRNRAAHFALLDARFRVVWTLELPHDYDAIEHKAFDDLLRDLGDAAAIPATRELGRFEVRRFSDDTIVTYEASEDSTASGGWRVAEVGRRKHESVAPPHEIAHAELREIAAVPLQVPWATAPIRDIEGFGFDAAGRLRFVRGEKEPRSYSLITLDALGGVVDERKVEPIATDSEGALEWTLLSNGDWFTTYRYQARDEAKSVGWLVDGASGGVEPVDALERFVVKGAAATLDGGFVAVVSARPWGGPPTLLMRFDAQARMSWQFDPSADVRSYFDSTGVADVVASHDGSVLLALRGYPEQRWLRFSANGEFLGAAPLPGRTVSHLVLEPSGTVLVCDRTGFGRWTRWSASCELLRELDLPEGALDDGVWSWSCADGTGLMWSTDGTRLRGFDEHGNPRIEFGAEPSAETMSQVGYASFDAVGHIALFDSHPKRVHVFDERGSAVPRGSFDEDALGYGRRYADPKNAFGWGRRSLDANKLEMRVEDGSITTSVERRADGRWFRYLGGFGVSSSGELAVIESPSVSSEGDTTLCLFARNGAPLGDVDLSSRSVAFGRPVVAFGRDWILVTNWIAPRAFLVSVATRQAWQVDAPIEHPSAPYAIFQLSPDQQQLWCVQFAPPILHRYALPAK